MPTALFRSMAALLAAGVAALLPAAAVAAPTPSPGATPVNRAGTSFLTATPITAGQPVRVDASIGDHLYWSFPATAGQVHEINATVTFPKGRGGASTWTVDVFDGLRRRQACTAGAQTPTVDAKASNVVLGCTLREVRPWAEPWSADPLPGTYVVRLSVIELPEADLGAPIDVDLLVGTIADRGASADDGELAAPLVPNTKAGTVLNAVPPVDAEADDESGSLADWLPDLGSRWVWTGIGGALAAVAGVCGFAVTRRPRRR
ncbi:MULTISPECIES: peptidase [Micromonospora]|uniref:peptidase n=1 Tax=Micromonospora TaxID=1873 RepID=UPI001EE8EB67|nr:MULTISPECIES: peptidase [Micromonospora]MCG5448987.1 peptidase [Micromonospora hortensis]MCX5118893.1 peptidase [Micromonospora sp. NBC_00362]